MRDERLRSWGHANAAHSIITFMPLGRRAPHTVLAGGGSGKKLDINFVIHVAGASSMLCSSTLTFTILSKDDPARFQQLLEVGENLPGFYRLAVPGMGMAGLRDQVVRSERTRIENLRPGTVLDVAALAMA